MVNSQPIGAKCPQYEFSANKITKLDEPEIPVLQSRSALPGRIRAKYVDRNERMLFREMKKMDKKKSKIALKSAGTGRKMKKKCYFTEISENYQTFKAAALKKFDGLIEDALQRTNKLDYATRIAFQLRVNFETILKNRSFKNEIIFPV